MVDEQKIKFKYETYVINLKRREDRLESFMKRCELSDVKIEYAFDGKNQEHEIQEDRELTNKFSNLMVGEIGCFISHMRLYKKLIESDLDFIVIFEDDAIFCEDFKFKFEKVLSEITDTMGLLYFGGRFDPNFAMPSEYYNDFSDSISHHNINPELKVSSTDSVWWHIRTTHGYIIFKNAAKKIFDIFTNSANITIAVDHWILINLINNSISVYDTKPLLCHCPFISDSDIR